MNNDEFAPTAEEIRQGLEEEWSERGEDEEFPCCRDFSCPCGGSARYFG